MVSYAFSRLRFKARKKFMNVGMILGMFPGFMTMIAIYYLLKAMGLTQTLVALGIVSKKPFEIWKPRPAPQL